MKGVVRFQFVNLHQLNDSDKKIILKNTSLRNGTVEISETLKKETARLAKKFSKYAPDFAILSSRKFKYEIFYLAFFKKTKPAKYNYSRRHNLRISKDTRKLLKLSQEYVDLKWKIIDSGYFIKNKQKVKIRKGMVWLEHPLLHKYHKTFSYLGKEDYENIANVAIYDKSSKKHYLALHILQFCPDKKFVVRTLIRTAKDNNYDINRISTMFLQTLCKTYPVPTNIIVDLLYKDKIKSVQDGLLIALRNSDRRILKILRNKKHKKQLSILAGWKCFYVSQYAKLLLKKLG